MYIKLSMVTEGDQAETLCESLTELGALSVSFRDAADEPIFQIHPDETPLWKNTKVDALFDENTTIETIIAALKQQNKAFTELDFTIEKIEEQDWVRITQQYFHPKQYNNTLWICPSWEKTDELQGTIVKIDPGLAFGTGTHPTTALCLEWIAKNPPKDQTVIDYGCGSGILSLAALAMGAKKVWAIDHDTQALIATENNAKLNEFYNPHALEITLPEDSSATQANLVIANILANPLIELAPKLINYLLPKGHLVLSGLLSNECDHVINAYDSKLKLIDRQDLDGWARLVFLSS